jgi:hypothetical protein
VLLLGGVVDAAANPDGFAKYEFKRAGDLKVPFLLEYASVSARIPSRVRVSLNDEIIEDVYIGPYTPHTWWSSNALIPESRWPKADVVVTIEVGAGAILRLESNLLAVAG